MADPLQVYAALIAAYPEMALTLKDRLTPKFWRQVERRAHQIRTDDAGLAASARRFRRR